MNKSKNIFYKFLWDSWCILSLIGIWPRFIEPKLIASTQIHLPLKGLSPDLAGLKIVQFSDLHFNSEMSDRFLKKMTKKILKNSPDIIVFTGDFLCYSKLQEKTRLKNFLNQLKAPYGCFAVFGNHDYEHFVSVNDEGEYDVIHQRSSTLMKGMERLFSQPLLKSTVTARAKSTQIHFELESLLKETPFKVLHNNHELINIKNTKLTICGLGEYSLGKCLPEVAFKNYDPAYPVVVLSHHPDSFSLLKQYPADLILCGHTHGGQVNLPFLRKRFTLIEHQDLVRGLVEKENKKIYINRGVGSVMNFRWFSMPEILTITLQKALK